jgi:fructose-1,6-bisphosphatase/inositol monophosphatase family enzyme
MSPSPPPGAPSSGWEARLVAMADAIRQAAHAELGAGLGTGQLPRPVGQGAGDVTYALDRATETVLEENFNAYAAQQALSLFTEDTGWRHRGPDGRGGNQELEGFDHGGPRLVVDPVDGTRNLMADLRSAWTVIALCPPGPAEPRLSEVELGLVSELCVSNAERFRSIAARRGGGARLSLRTRLDGHTVEEASLNADDDDRVDHGYFSFFRYTPALRPIIARLEVDFFGALEREEGADLRHCFEDQYISNGGQLALLSLGTYRFIADLRADLAPRIDAPCTTSKPYDCAGALLVAQEAGCVIRAADGGELDFPLDATTPVSFVGYANSPTAARLAPHLERVRSALNTP